MYTSQTLTTYAYARALATDTILPDPKSRHRATARPSDYTPPPPKQRQKKQGRNEGERAPQGARPHQRDRIGGGRDVHKGQERDERTAGQRTDARTDASAITRATLAEDDNDNESAPPQAHASPVHRMSRAALAKYKDADAEDRHVWGARRRGLRPELDELPQRREGIRFHPVGVTTTRNQGQSRTIKVCDSPH
ncbi:hypothetical protein MSAN_02427300 [Mycena sanguinolenta]|uniref:Uncharacterized protein n=1 Tax=Mycena sanguinolenta TaxID=230812 RepID=A0A8H7CEQ0_9AGAR|nr:hypothetical protein MSAN_02427300 [Mycena sanguinolenta]